MNTATSALAPDSFRYAPRALLAILRVYLGVILFITNLGKLTRVGATVAMFLFLNYMLAKGRMFWAPDSQDAAVFFIALVVFLGRAGRVWGVDAYLAKRWPKSPLW